MTSFGEPSRRRFLRTSLAGGLAALSSLRLPAVARAQRGPTTAPDVAVPPARVALTAGGNRADNTFRALKAFEKEIAQAIGRKRVIVKPNNVVIDRPLCASHADQLEGILDFLKSIGKTGDDVVIAESPAFGSVMEGFANYGYNRFVGKYGLKLVDLDQQGFERLYCFNETSMRPVPCRMSKMMLDPDSYIISAAKLKTHDLVVATLSLKNIVVAAAIKEGGGGRGGRSDKGITHGGGPRGINYNLAALAPRLHPHLAVIDGFEGMEGTGPVNGTPVDHRVCVVSPDWFAADRVGLALMGIDLNNVGYLTYAAEAGMGQADLEKIEILGPAIKDHAKSYKLPANVDRLLSWQKPLCGA
jgi:uncharacterized protein (DUF362 family)